MDTPRLRTVDAFTDRPFSGNPAGVVLLERPRSADWMAALAAELGYSATAFVIPDELPGADYRLRWFSPAVELDMCGHATLAAAHCLFGDGVDLPVRFATRSGVLTVSAMGDGALRMDFPACPPSVVPAPDGLAEALGDARPLWVGRGATDDLLVALADAGTVRQLRPDLAAVARLGGRSLLVTAAADGPDHDFVSRVFAPRIGIPEDPVTGSAHTVLGPYWAAKLGRDELTGRQLSARGGVIGIRVAGDRVLLTGRAVTVLQGHLTAAAAPVDLAEQVG
ncbi:MAG TPA: PhzF family phenazine biosynthesis protein [Jatrophihabitans sp.]|jgi:PhzF family phenazine biosynthesis protein|uniref:PhzF family phenazine biosynthesis protein n=1 Tax=Jatrophihabitans sp. TaxID=1932789 RepID=UPI002EE40AE4